MGRPQRARGQQLFWHVPLQHFLPSVQAALLPHMQVPLLHVSASAPHTVLPHWHVPETHVGFLPEHAGFWPHLHSVPVQVSAVAGLHTTPPHWHFALVPVPTHLGFRESLHGSLLPHLHVWLAESHLFALLASHTAP